MCGGAILSGFIPPSAAAAAAKAAARKKQQQQYQQRRVTADSLWPGIRTRKAPRSDEDFEADFRDFERDSGDEDEAAEDGDDVVEQVPPPRAAAKRFAFGVKAEAALPSAIGENRGAHSTWLLLFPLLEDASLLRRGERDLPLSICQMDL
jgi:EREBP-like factor